MKKLKAMFKHMKQSGVERPIKTYPLREKEVKKIFLDLKNLHKVIDFVPLDDGLKKVKDLLIFQCHTALPIVISPGFLNFISSRLERVVSYK